MNHINPMPSTVEGKIRSTTNTTELTTGTTEDTQILFSMGQLALGHASFALFAATTLFMVVG